MTQWPQEQVARGRCAMPHGCAPAAEPRWPRVPRAWTSASESRASGGGLQERTLGVSTYFRTHKAAQVSLPPAAAAHRAVAASKILYRVATEPQRPKPLWPRFGSSATAGRPPEFACLYPVHPVHPAAGREDGRNWSSWSAVRTSTAVHTYAIATRRVAGAEDNGPVLLLLDIRGQRYRK